MRPRGRRDGKCSLLALIMRKESSPSASGGLRFRERADNNRNLVLPRRFFHTEHTHTQTFLPIKPHSSIMLANVTWFQKARLNTHAVNLSFLRLVGVSLLFHPGTFLQRRWIFFFFFQVFIYLFVWLRVWFGN